MMNAVACAQLTIQMLNLLQNTYTAGASIQQHGTANVEHNSFRIGEPTSLVQVVNPRYQTPQEQPGSNYECRI